MSKFLSIAKFETDKKKDPASVEGCKMVLSASEFEAMYQKDPKLVAGYYVSKKDFFALTVLREMKTETKDSEGSIVVNAQAAEDTYQRWLAGKRVRQEQEAIEDPYGLTEDTLHIFIECRFVNLERKRHEKNQRIIEESRKRVAAELMPAALQN